MDNYEKFESAVEKYNSTTVALRTEVDCALKTGDGRKVEVLYSTIRGMFKTMLSTGQEIGLGNGSGSVRRKLDASISTVEELIAYVEREAKERKIPLSD